MPDVCRYCNRYTHGLNPEPKPYCSNAQVLRAYNGVAQAEVKRSLLLADDTHRDNTHREDTHRDSDRKTGDVDTLLRKKKASSDGARLPAEGTQERSLAGQRGMSLATGMSFSFLDLFDVVLPLFDLSYDEAHYQGPVGHALALRLVQHLAALV